MRRPRCVLRRSREVFGPMQISNAAKGCSLAALMVICLTTASSFPQNTEPLPLPELRQNSQPPVSADEVFADLVKHNEIRSARLREYSALRIYAVTEPKGKVHAKETVRMEYVAPDKKTFVPVSEEGSSVIRNLVLKRLMESEISAAAGTEHRDSSITPANYTFRVLGEEDLGAHHCLVIEALPKRKDKYLFEGKVWIDRSEFAVAQIVGHPAKKLSFWITRADFVRQYEKIGDFWLPAKDQTFVDVRLYGRKILSIEHHINSINGVTTAPPGEQHPPSVESWR
jgi:hypothetical protein